MKRQKTIEVDVCDVCGREGHLPQRCCVCQKELCEYCDRILRVEVHEGHGNSDGVLLTGWTVTTANKGYRGVYCPEHVQQLGETLRAAGFTDFEYRPPWAVTLDSCMPNLTRSTGGATVQGGNLTLRGSVLGGAPSDLPMVDIGSTRAAQGTVLATMPLERLTVKQVAGVTGYTPSRIRQLLWEGRLAHEQTPLGRLIPRYALDALTQRRRPQRATPPREGTIGPGAWLDEMPKEPSAC